MERVLLVKKARPTSQFGKLNGIGGKIEPGEDVYTAMEREAEEEAGITPGQVNWHLFGEMSFRQSGARVFLFSGRDPGCDGCLCAWTPEQKTEPIEWVDVTMWGRMMPNLRWLLPMAMGYEFSPFDGPAVIQFP
jgi:8-oxo-dGTP diphosphatase